MKICIVSYMYPSKYNSADFVFVKNLVDEFARQGHECVVVSPFWTMKYRHWSSSKSEYFVDEIHKVTVNHPNFISVSNLKLGSIYVSPLLHRFAVKRALKKMSFNPDVVYCHFWKQGLEAFSYASKNMKPLFVATGECEIFVNNKDGHLNDFVRYVKGVICVSSKNKDESIGLSLTSGEKCCIVPNSIDNNVFRVLNKNICRQDLGLSQDQFIVAYVGSFNNRKGTLRLSEAISRITDNNVYSMFIGSGGEDPNCPNILYKGNVIHNDLPKYLCAADVFVLPTLQEGCCNAIVEAMACGLPIISSNLSFNWDILNKYNSILVDPMNVDEIKDAIIRLRDDSQLRQRMSAAAIEMSQELTIEKRAKKIISFIENCIEK